MALENHVVIDLYTYNSLIEDSYLLKKANAENLRLKEEKLQLEEDVSDLKSVVNDKPANDELNPEEECMTDPSQNDATVKTELQESSLSNVLFDTMSMSNVINNICLGDLEIGNNFSQIKKTDLVKLNIALAKLCDTAEDIKNKIHKLLINN